MTKTCGLSLSLILVAVAVGISACSGGGTPAINALPAGGSTRTSPVDLPSETHIYEQDSSDVFVWPISADGNAAPTLDIGNATGCVIGFSTGVAVDSAGKLFVPDSSRFSVQQYQVDFAIPNVALASSIAGNATGITRPHQDAVDKDGRLYVTDFQRIMVYGPGAKGNAAPIATIAGPHTGLNVVTGGEGPIGVAVDPIGTIYAVTRFFGSPPTGAVLIFAPGSNGDVAPISIISGNNTLLSDPGGVALDRNGNIYVANDATSGITVYAPGSNGNVAPIRHIFGPPTGLGDTVGVAVDSAGRLYASTKNGASTSIVVFAPNADGEHAAPISTIVGENTLLFIPGEIAVH